MELLTGLHQPTRIIPLPAAAVGSFQEFEEVGRRLSAR
jgi:hypothetical protein